MNKFKFSKTKAAIDALTKTYQQVARAQSPFKEDAIDSVNRLSASVQKVIPSNVSDLKNEKKLSQEHSAVVSKAKEYTDSIAAKKAKAGNLAKQLAKVKAARHAREVAVK